MVPRHDKATEFQFLGLRPLAGCASLKLYHVIPFPRQLKVIGVLTSNKEGKVICEIKGRVLWGMQFGVLVEVLGGMQFGVLVEGLFCEIDGRVIGGM